MAHTKKNFLSRLRGIWYRLRATVNQRSAFIFSLGLISLCIIAVLQWDTNRVLQLELATLRSQPVAVNSQPLGGARTKVEGIQGDDHVLGSRQASVFLIEYTDFECPYCRSFQHTVDKLKAQYLPTQVAWVVRQFPLPIHAGASAKAQASECIAQAGGDPAFWKFVATDFSMDTSNFPLSKINEIATSLGVDGQLVTQCVASGQFAARVAHDQQTGNAIGVQGTPTTVLLKRDGTSRVLLGSLSYDQLKAAVDQMLN